MKSLITSIVLFAILLTVIFLNAIYINEESLKLAAIAKKLESIDSDDFEEGFSELESEWESFRRLADASCQYSDLNKIDQIIGEMKSRAATNCPEDYETARQTLILLLKELPRLERINLNALI